MNFLLYLIGVIAALALFAWTMVGFALVAYLKALTDEVNTSFEEDPPGDQNARSEDEDCGDWWKKQNVP